MASAIGFSFDANGPYYAAFAQRKAPRWRVQLISSDESDDLHLRPGQLLRSQFLQCTLVIDRHHLVELSQRLRPVVKDTFRHR